MDPPKGTPSKTVQLPLKDKSPPKKKYRLWTQHPHNRNLWDIVLRCDNEVNIHANRSDLADWSEYFEKLFLGSFKDSDSKEVLLEGICGQSLKVVIEGLYSGTIVLSTDSVAGVLYAVDRLQIVDVVEQCEQFMTNNMNNAMAPLFYRLADKHSLQKLKQATQEYIQDHLPSVVQDKSGGMHFVGLGNECIMHFLTTCNTKWRSGAYLLQLLVTLTSTGLSHQEVIDCIDVEKCSVEQLNEIRAHPAVQEAGSRQFIDRIAATALRHVEYLSRNHSPDFQPNVGLHLEDGESKLAVCWHIRNWAEQSQKETLCSPEFIIPGKGSWKMELYPKDDVNGSHLSIFCERDGCCSKEVELIYGICMINCSAKSHVSDKIEQPSSTLFSEFTCSWGESEFMSLDTLDKERDIWICDDTIVLALIYKP